MKVTTQAKRRLVSVAVALALVALSPVHTQSASAMRFGGRDLDCADFGTRERAQHELDSADSDVYHLDGDGDGRACEWNGSTGWMTWPLTGIAMVVARFASRRRRGDATQVTGIEGLWHNYKFDENGEIDYRFDGIGIAMLTGGGFVAMSATNVLRDYVLPRSFTPVAIHALAMAAAFGLVFLYDQRRHSGSTPG